MLNYPNKLLKIERTKLMTEYKTLKYTKIVMVNYKLQEYVKTVQEELVEQDVECAIEFIPKICTIKKC
jgi:hypothetical protein